MRRLLTEDENLLAEHLERRQRPQDEEEEEGSSQTGFTRLEASRAQQVGRACNMGRGE